MITQQLGLHPKVLKSAYPNLSYERIAIGLGKSVRQISRYCSTTRPQEPPLGVMMQTYNFYRDLKEKGIHPEYQELIEQGITELGF